MLASEAAIYPGFPTTPHPLGEGSGEDGTFATCHLKTAYGLAAAVFEPVLAAFRQQLKHPLAPPLADVLLCCKRIGKIGEQVSRRCERQSNSPRTGWTASITSPIWSRCRHVARTGRASLFNVPASHQHHCRPTVGRVDARDAFAIGVIAMSKEVLHGLIADVDRLLAAGGTLAPSDEGLRRREKAVRELGESTALAQVADKVKRVLNAKPAEASRELLDLLLVTRQIGVSLAKVGTDGSMEAVPESGPWKTSSPADDLYAVLEAESVAQERHRGTPGSIRSWHCSRPSPFLNTLGHLPRSPFSVRRLDR